MHPIFWYIVGWVVFLTAVLIFPYIAFVLAILGIVSFGVIIAILHLYGYKFRHTPEGGGSNWNWKGEMDD